MKVNFGRNFFDGDVADIQQVPVSGAGTDDYLAWNYTKQGLFSVKSAYHLKVQLKSFSWACGELKYVYFSQGLAQPLGRGHPKQGKNPCVEASQEWSCGGR